MVVRLDHARDPQTVALGFLDVLLDRVRRVDDEGLAGVGGADQIGGAAEIVVDELAEEHVYECTEARR